MDQQPKTWPRRTRPSYRCDLCQRDYKNEHGFKVHRMLQRHQRLARAYKDAKERRRERDPIPSPSPAHDDEPSAMMSPEPPTPMELDGRRDFQDEDFDDEERDGADRSDDAFETSQEAGDRQTGDPPLETNARQGATMSGEERERMRRIEAEEVRRALELLTMEW
ncbi:hypothetical protein JCM3766R1_004276 [Sporobolomyces carnicolor]